MVTVQVPAVSLEPEICSGLQVVVDAAGAAGLLTMRTVSPLRATSVQVPSSSTILGTMPSTSSRFASVSQSAAVMNGVTVARVTTGGVDGRGLAVGASVGASDAPGSDAVGVGVDVPASGDGATMDGSTTLVATGDGCGSGSSSEQDVSVSSAASPATPAAQMRRCRCMDDSP